MLITTSSDLIKPFDVHCQFNLIASKMSKYNRNIKNPKSKNKQNKTSTRNAKNRLIMGLVDITHVFVPNFVIPITVLSVWK